MRPEHKPWTEADRAQLVAEYPLYPSRVLAERMGRSEGAVRNAMSALRKTLPSAAAPIKQHAGRTDPAAPRVAPDYYFWNGAREATLRALYPIHPTREVAARLGCTPKAVSNKASKLRLRKERATCTEPALPPTDPETAEALAEEARGKPKVEVITTDLPAGYVRVLRHTWFHQQRPAGWPAR